MLSIIEEIIINFDKFAYVPQLGFTAKKNQGTFFGGFSTILMGVLIFYYMGNELKLMAELKGYNLISIISVANLTDIGIVKLEDMGTLPFFSVHYKGHAIPLKS